MHKKSAVVVFISFALIISTMDAFSQSAEALLQRVRTKLGSVSDYQAKGVLTTNVSFMKVPASDVTILFKNPDKFKIKKQEGISVVPKGGVSINLNSLVASGNYSVVPSGTSVVGGKTLSVIKLLPLQENSEVVVTTLYISENDALIRKANTTTRDNGTYSMEMEYGKYGQYGLPDKLTFVFNTKDFKLPKGVTFEYDSGVKPENTAKKSQDGKGSVVIVYSSYIINKGISDNLF